MLTCRCTNANRDVIPVCAPERDVCLHANGDFSVDDGILIDCDRKIFLRLLIAGRDLDREGVSCDRGYASGYGLNRRSLVGGVRLDGNRRPERRPSPGRHAVASGNSEQRGSSVDCIHNTVLRTSAPTWMREHLARNVIYAEKQHHAATSVGPYPDRTILTSCKTAADYEQFFPVYLLFYNLLPSRNCSATCVADAGVAAEGQRAYEFTPRRAYNRLWQHRCTIPYEGGRACRVSARRKGQPSHPPSRLPRKTVENSTEYSKDGSVLMTFGVEASLKSRTLI